METADRIHRVELPFGGRVEAAHLRVGSRAAMPLDTASGGTAGQLGGYPDRLGLPPDRVRYGYAWRDP